jgi:hypothetical protein
MAKTTKTTKTYRKIKTPEKNHFKYQVDIYCRPAVSIWVEANSPQDAEEKAWEMIDERTPFLTQEQKDQLIEDILDNVEEVQATGDMEGLSDEEEN